MHPRPNLRILEIWVHTRENHRHRVLLVGELLNSLLEAVRNYLKKVVMPVQCVVKRRRPTNSGDCWRVAVRLTTPYRF